jgi:hypothetical protein
MPLPFDPESLPWLERAVPGLHYLWVPTSALDAHLTSGFEMVGMKAKPDGSPEFYHLLFTGTPLPGLSVGSVAPDVSIYIPDDTPPAPPPSRPTRKTALESLSPEA